MLLQVITELPSCFPMKYILPNLVHSITKQKYDILDEIFTYATNNRGLSITEKTIIIFYKCSFNKVIIRIVNTKYKAPKMHFRHIMINLQIYFIEIRQYISCYIKYFKSF